MVFNIEEIEKRIADSYELPNNVINAIPHPLVTVRTSTYQHAPYIKKCIESILMQKTTFPFEYIIGEDFSTDGTREIVFEIAEKYPNIIRVVTADYNVGMKANGIRCVKKYRGKYIAYCEGDDYWTDPLKLQKQVDFLESHPDYGLVHTELDHLYVKTGKYVKNHWKKCKVTNQEGDIYDLLLGNQGSMIYLCTACFRSDFLKSYEEIINIGISCDLSFFLFIASKSKIGYINESTAVRNVLTYSFTQGQDFKHKLNVTDLLYRIYKYFDAIKPFNPKSVYIFKQNHALRICNICYDFREDYKLFEKNYNTLDREYRTNLLKIKKILFRLKIPINISTFILKFWNFFLKLLK